MCVNEGKIFSMENRITRKFIQLRAQGKKGLITFITAGDPDLDTTVELVLEMAQAGVDIVELGVPYSDPLADGPTIQKASLRALEKGTNLRGIFAAVEKIRRKSSIPLILMTYYNPLLKYGLGAFAEEAALAGADGVIVPDLPMEEAEMLSSVLERSGLFLIPLVAPTSGEDRITDITAGEKGFIYCVSLTGVTGVRQGIPDGLPGFLNLVRRQTNNPLAVGFGVSTPEQAAQIAQSCDAVIVGSALVKTIEDNLENPDIKDIVIAFVRSLRAAL